MTNAQIRALIAIADSSTEPVKKSSARALEDEGLVEAIDRPPHFRLTAAGLRELPHARIVEAISRIPSSTLQTYFSTVVAKASTGLVAEEIAKKVRRDLRDAHHRGEPYVVPSRARAIPVRPTALDLSCVDLVVDALHRAALSEAS